MLRQSNIIKISQSLKVQIKKKSRNPSNQSKFSLKQKQRMNSFLLRKHQNILSSIVGSAKKNIQHIRHFLYISNKFIIILFLQIHFQKAHHLHFNSFQRRRNIGIQEEHFDLNNRSQMDKKRLPKEIENIMMNSMVNKNRCQYLNIIHDIQKNANQLIIFIQQYKISDIMTTNPQYPQMKTALELYIETNHSFIMQKLYSKFRIEIVKDYELKDLDIENMVELIEEIFMFGKNNDEMRTFYQRRYKNIQKFIDQKYKGIDATQDMPIDTDVLLMAIKYCVSNGFDPIKQEPKKQTQKQQIKEQIQRQQQSPIIPQKIQKPRKFIVPKPKTPQIKNFIQKYDMPDRKKPSRYMINISPKKKPQKPQQPQIYVQPVDQSILQKNKQILDKRLQKLYQHYCSQQQNVGSNATFDKIQSECNHMTIGKFMLFCKITNLFKHKEITKQILQSKYRQISDGKQQIDYQHFKQLLKNLDQKYISQKSKQSSHPEKNIPSFQARLFLNSPNHFKKMKKDIDLPFTTRQRQGRQLKKYQYNTLDVSSLPSSHRKSMDPTMHSGKFSKNLRQYIQTKQEDLKQIKKSKIHKKSVSQSNKHKIIRFDNLGRYNWPGMQWAIVSDADQDPFIDSIMMKDMRAKNIAGEARKRASELQKIQNSNNKYNRY